MIKIYLYIDSFLFQQKSNCCSSLKICESRKVGPIFGPWAHFGPASNPAVLIDAQHFLRELPSTTVTFGDLMLDLCIYTTTIGQDDLLNELYEHDKNLPFNLTKAFLEYCL